MARYRLTLPLIIGITLGSLMPILYFVQLLLDKGAESEVWVEGSLAVSIDNQNSLSMPVVLVESESEAGLHLSAVTLLQQGEYPWDPTPWEGSLHITLNYELLENALRAHHHDSWSAWFSERLVSRSDRLGLPPIPCTGIVSVRELEKTEDWEENSQITLDSLQDLSLSIDLQCTSAGADLIWNTGDEKTWTIEGPLSLVRGRRNLSQ
jgi:hypothetical protein